MVLENFPQDLLLFPDQPGIPNDISKHDGVFLKHSLPILMIGKLIIKKYCLGKSFNNPGLKGS
jgi:hypothetical protein